MALKSFFPALRAVVFGGILGTIIFFFVYGLFGMHSEGESGSDLLAMIVGIPAAFVVGAVLGAVKHERRMRQREQAEGPQNGPSRSVE